MDLKTFLTWAPRIIGILIITGNFISELIILITNFGPSIMSIVVIVTLLLFLLAWKKPLAGGIVFTLLFGFLNLGALFLNFNSICIDYCPEPPGLSGLPMLILYPGSGLLMGILFLTDGVIKLKGKKQLPSKTEEK